MRRFGAVCQPADPRAIHSNDLCLDLRGDPGDKAQHLLPRDHRFHRFLSAGKTVQAVDPGQPAGGRPFFFQRHRRILPRHRDGRLY